MLTKRQRDIKLRGMEKVKPFKLTVYISQENANKLGHKAVDDKKSKSEIVDDILTEYFLKGSK